MMLPQVKLAASPEGLIVLAILYGIFALIGKAKKAGEKQVRPKPEEPQTTGQADASTAQGNFSLEAVLREIQRVKQEAERRQAPPPKKRPPAARPQTQSEYGPLGRHSKTRLPSSEEFEDRTSLEDQGSIEGPGRLKDFDDTRRRRVEVDQDDAAEAVIQRRMKEVEARNRPFSEQDHRSFHEKVKATDPAQPRRALGLTPGQLKTAFVWKEILGPPKALE
jgi:hypothetical protein